MNKKKYKQLSKNKKTTTTENNKNKQADMYKLK